VGRTFTSHRCNVINGGYVPVNPFYILARPGRDADHSPPSSAEVVNE
jgi:hypothetical protein